MKNGLPLLSVLADGRLHSVEALSKELGVSAARIGELMRQLEAMGISVEIDDCAYRLKDRLELLSRKKIADNLSPVARRYSQTIEILFDTVSTNTYLLTCPVSQRRQGHVVLAEYQSRGRGRGGSYWLSPLAGGLTFSIFWRFNSDADVLSGLSLYVGLAIARALRSLGIERVGLKWPNDILIKDAKLGGVLIETRTVATGAFDTVIGVGINYHLSEKIVAGTSAVVTDICQNTTRPLSRNRIAGVVLSYIFGILEETERGATAGLMNEWRQYDCYQGKSAVLSSRQGTVEGFVEGVSDQGKLLIAVDGVTKSYPSGELSLRLKQ